MSSITDFLLDQKIEVEVGGSAKRAKPGETQQGVVYALDGITVGQGSVIPLYLFGFLY